MTLLGLSKQGVCWSTQSPSSAPATSIPITSSVTPHDTETSSPVTAAPSQSPSQNQRVVLPPDVKQALIDASLRHLQSLSAHSNPQSNAQSSSDLQSNFDVRGVSNVLYALGSMGCRWRTAKETRAMAKASGDSEPAETEEGDGILAGLPLSMQTAVVDALVAALSADHKGGAAVSSEDLRAHRAQSNSQSNVAVSLEDLSHLLHALAHMGFDFQVTRNHHNTLPHTTTTPSYHSIAHETSQHNLSVIHLDRPYQTASTHLLDLTLLFVSHPLPPLPSP